jgi:hypothetical protein
VELSNAKMAIAPGCVASNIGIAQLTTCKINKFI